MLPLLQASVVPPGWVGNDAFLAGYGAAQALPGPVFTFAAYLGTVDGDGASWLDKQGLGRRAALVSWRSSCPGFCWWSAHCRSGACGGAGNPGDARGVAQGRQRRAVVGLRAGGALHAGLDQRHPRRRRDVVLGLAAAFLLLVFWRAPPWFVVVLGAVAAEVLARI